MIRPIEKKDREAYLKMAEIFYNSNAVLSPVPKENFEKTFELLLAENPYAEGYILEKDSLPCGYALLAKTWSQEAGGLTVWVEEIFVSPEMRGLGLGKEFFTFLESRYQNAAKRFRLEVEDENEGAVRLYKSLGFEFFPYKQMKKEF